MADPFAEEDTGKGKGYVHVRVQQRNGRKSLTTVQGLKKEYDYNKILRKFKKVKWTTTSTEEALTLSL